jgi:hypothetical protein
MISYKTKNGTFDMKFFMEVSILTFFKFILMILHYDLLSFEKKISKVQKMVTLGSTSAFFSSTTPYRRTQE